MTDAGDQVTPAKGTVLTRIDADPSEFNAIADWLGPGLGAGRDDACPALRSARQNDGGWQGEAADVFRSRMDEAHGLAVDLDDAFDTPVRAIETFAEALRAALDGAALLEVSRILGELAVQATVSNVAGTAAAIGAGAGVGGGIGSVFPDVGAVVGAASGAVEWAADGLSDAWDWAFS